MVKVIDAHCDLLDKMALHPEMDFRQDSVYADVSYPRLQRAGMVLQCFAVYLSDRQRITFERLLEGFDLFHQKIAVHNNVQFVRTKQDLESAAAMGRLGAMLTLEGADGLEGSMVYLRTAFYLGVRMMGLTWNQSNWAADGVMEPRKGGLTVKGKQLVRECNKLGLILDVSHLGEKGFWELIELSTKPLAASHSNAQSVCSHPRNLTDDQIKALIVQGGIAGLTFVPWFVKTSEPGVKDILTHIDHICGLGGVRHVGFGSDFDGIDYHIPGLEHPAHYERLANELHKRYTAEEAEGFLSGNWHRFFMENLPDDDGD
ncbi:dipeptidase [Gorillibacterium sp. sgz5001074]|uniref:dipeptidase n=1 Tax=Gorillibacterium sp. sgz5001074 TaxID=3446695 RepID=UPI003F677101